MRRHYQWIVVHELLRRIVGEATLRHVLPEGGPVRREHFRWRRFPYLPVEFSAAAYRFGHSMVRNEYGLRRHPPGKDAEAPLPIFPALAGFRPLTPERRLDWERFFKLPGHGLEAQASFGIDTVLAEPLYHLPDGDPKLARRNLLRGRALGLPSGQRVARAIEAPALSEDELMIDADLPAGVRRTLLRSTPLWYYVLAEAEHEPGRTLGRVGGLIVAEVLAGLLEADPSSFLHEPDWRPDLGDDGDFTMADLVRVAREDGSGGAQGEQPGAVPEL